MCAGEALYSHSAFSACGLWVKGTPSGNPAWLSSQYGVYHPADLDLYICAYFGRKRTVSEVQLMHNLGEHEQVQERREWLQRRLHGIHTVGLNNGDEPGWARKEIASRELPNLRVLTPGENALNVLEELLKSQQ